MKCKGGGYVICVYCGVEKKKKEMMMMMMMTTTMVAMMVMMKKMKKMKTHKTDDQPSILFVDQLPENNSPRL